MTAVVLALLAGVPVDALVPGAPGVLRGHTDSVTAIAFSPDGQTLASASRDTSIRLWSLDAGTEIASIGAEKSQINALAFSPDGGVLATGNVELQVRLLEVATGSVKHVVAFADAVLEMAFSPDGVWLAVSGPSGLTSVYSVADGKGLPVSLRGRSVRFGADSKTVALGQLGGGVTVVDVRSGKVRKTIATPDQSPMVTMTADGALLATWNAKDRAIHLWNTATGKSGGVLVMEGKKDRFQEATVDTIRSLALTRDGAYAVCTTADRRLRVWDVAKKTVIASYGLDQGGPVAVSADGRRIAVADGSTIKLWPLVAP